MGGGSGGRKDGTGKGGRGGIDGMEKGGGGGRWGDFVRFKGESVEVRLKSCFRC